MVVSRAQGSLVAFDASLLSVSRKPSTCLQDMAGRTNERGFQIGRMEEAEASRPLASEDRRRWISMGTD